MHRPVNLPIKPRRRSQNFRLFSLLFFILTLIECREIMNTWHYGGQPALHIVVLAAMNCPSGPFRSEFLISNWSLACLFFTVIVAYGSRHREEVFSSPMTCQAL